MENKSIDAVGKDGLTLHIEFIHRGDRYGHLISVAKQTGQVDPIWESVEGTAADEWPPSPPLQSLSIETLAPDRHAALLVGMAGHNHWSASIEPVPGEAALVLDIACRTCDRGESLGSLYRVLSQDTSQIAVTAELACDVQPIGKDTIAILASEAHAPGTIRWKYRISAMRA